MTIQERLRLNRLINKMNQQEEIAKELGLKDVSKINNNSNSKHSDKLSKEYKCKL